MQKFFILLLATAPFFVKAQTGVGINTTTPDASAQLDINSSTKGVLLPRLTTVQRNGMTSPATGLMIFNTTDSTVQVNTGTPTAPIWSSARGGDVNNISLNSNTSPAGKTVGQMVYNTNAGSGVPVGPVYWNGTTWVSAAGSNIYNADGALTGNRTVSLASNNLIFAGGKVGINTASPAVGLHANSAFLVSSNGTANSQGTYLVWNDPNVGGTNVGVSGFLNHRGGGSGGFVFSGTDDNNTFKEYLRIAGSGHVNVNNSIDDANSMFRLTDNGAGATPTTPVSATNNLRLDNTYNNAKILIGSSAPTTGGYNPIVSAGDARLIFNTDGNAASTADSGFVIAPHSLTASGVKIMESGSVGINTASPDKSAVLDATSTTKGLLPPRLTTTQRDAIVSPASGLVIYNTIDSSLQVNTGSPAVPRWTRAQLDNRSNFFYAPTVSIPVTALVTNQTLDLWASYKNQFSLPAYKNNSAPLAIPTYENNQLNYYITSYDNTIIKINSLSDTGLLNYDVISTTPSFSSYINVVFTVK